MERVTFYANNVPVEVALDFSLSYPDWCQMKEEAWFPELCSFLKLHETQGNIDNWLKEADLEEIEESDTGYPQVFGFSSPITRKGMSYRPIR